MLEIYAPILQYFNKDVNQISGTSIFCSLSAPHDLTRWRIPLLIVVMERPFHSLQGKPVAVFGGEGAGLAGGLGLMNSIKLY